MKAHTDEWAEGVVKAYNFPPQSLALALKNISLRWEIDDSYMEQARVLGEQLEILKQVKKQPDYKTFFNTDFVKPLMKGR